MVIDPSAIRCYTPAQEEYLKKFEGKPFNARVVEIDLDRIEMLILEEVWGELNTGNMGNIEGVVMKEIFTQIQGNN